MNRRERRHMQKKLGLNKHYKNQTREQMFERWADNLENGRRMEDEMRNNVTQSLQEQADQKVSDMISGRAEQIAKQKSIPVIDAMLMAQEEYTKNQNA